MVEVSTEMDGLLALLEESDSIKISDVTRILGVPKERIESWAKMLEKEGMVEVKYSLVGGVLIKRGAKFKEAGRKLPAAAPQRSGQAVKFEILSRKPSSIPPKPVDYSVLQKNIGALEAREVRGLKTSLTEEEGEITEEIKHLREEEGVVIEFMRALVDEGERLSTHIRELRELIETLEAKKDGAKE